MGEKVCVVTGIGPGLGSAYARRFAAGGYRVALLGRTRAKLEQYAAEIEGSLAVVCDVADAASVASAFKTIRAQLGEPTVVVHNAGSGVFKGFLDTTAEELRSSFDVNVGGLFHVAKEALPAMVDGDGGSIIVTGATASWRGSPKTAAFAASKGGQRWLAQALAKEFAPQGVHVSYIIIDGMVDLPRTRSFMPDKSTADFVSPAAVADMAWFLAHQAPGGWTFELDARPAPESW
ncbi:MAG: NAD(P)-dependent dehydrogenase (short-subunit alcohol dehydrogenase family) [Myxococcota bacterium]|jgi:NAD(P)-dependent dehydrogenase (short-subunit alcohol dehydrogenase family)